MIVERIKIPVNKDLPLVAPAGSSELNHQNWVSAKHVRVNFDIKHDGANIYLSYYVTEDQVRAVNSDYNSPVWEDSCVEFFFSLEGDEENYYNFEFNAIGTRLGAYGKNRNEREWLSVSLLEQIETHPSLGRKPFGIIDEVTSWSLFVKIPVSTFCFNEIHDITGRDGHGNFYKCGDKLHQPHFLSWKPVLTQEPNFHTPRYFGQLSFL